MWCNEVIALVNANSLHIPLRDESIHTVVTSPPYYALRDYKTDGQLGLEKRADCLGWATGQPCGECYICQMVAVFREVKRVLRKDGVCFLNIGDSYANGSSGGQNNFSSSTLSGGKGMRDPFNKRELSKMGDGLKPKDMMLIPQRLALALQADGWWVRSDIIWAKPNPMPESVTDRPTKSHEYIWLLAKSKDYFWDQEAVREAIKDVTIQRLGQNNFANQKGGAKDPKTGNRSERRTLENLKERYSKEGVWDDRFTGYELWKEKGIGRNIRTVWEIPTQPYSGAHYATYPEELVLRCLKAAISERGCCPKCGKQWERMIDRMSPGKHESEKQTVDSGRGNGGDRSKHAEPSVNLTTGFRPSCSHDLPPVPATILDPFAGSGTTLLVAKRMGLNAIGLDLSYQYLRENAWQRVQMTQPSIFTRDDFTGSDVFGTSVI